MEAGQAAAMPSGVRHELEGREEELRTQLSALEKSTEAYVPALKEALNKVGGPSEDELANAFQEAIKLNSPKAANAIWRAFRPLLERMLEEAKFDRIAMQEDIGSALGVQADRVVGGLGLSVRVVEQPSQSAKGGEYA